MYKDPITDPGKKSKKGKLTLEVNDGKFSTCEQGTGDPKKVCNFYLNCKYSKTCVKQPLKRIDKTKIYMTNGSLMKIESIAECCPWSILQNF